MLYDVGRRFQILVRKSSISQDISANCDIYMLDFHLYALMCTLCLGSLLCHAVVWPYKDYRSNIAEAFSEYALLLIALINLARGVIDSTQQKPDSYVQNVLNKFDKVDESLQLWLSLLGIILLLGLIIY